MPSINIFKLGDTFVFKQFFDDRALFVQLGGYYNNAKYRFEIPPDDLKNVQDMLQAAGYDVEVIESLRDFLVSIGKFQKHKQILKNSVEVEEVDEEKVFLMKDKESVEMALSQGAKKYEGELFS